MASKKQQQTGETKSKNIITTGSGLCLNVKQVEKHLKSQFDRDFGDNGPKIGKSGLVGLTAAIESLIKMISEDVTLNVKENPKDGLRTVQQSHITSSIGNSQARFFNMYVFSLLYTFDPTMMYDKSLPIDVKDVADIFEKNNNIQLSPSGKNYLCYLICMFFNRIYDRVRENLRNDKKTGAKSFSDLILKRAIRTMDLNSAVVTVLCNKVDESVDKYNKHNKGENDKDDDGESEEEEIKSKKDTKEEEESEEEEPKKKDNKKKAPESDEEPEKKPETKKKEVKPETKRSSAGSKKSAPVAVFEDEEDEEEVIVEEKPKKPANKSKAKK